MKLAYTIASTTASTVTHTVFMSRRTIRGNTDLDARVSLLSAIDAIATVEFTEALSSIVPEDQLSSVVSSVQSVVNSQSLAVTLPDITVDQAHMLIYDSVCAVLSPDSH